LVTTLNMCRAEAADKARHLARIQRIGYALRTEAIAGAVLDIQHFAHFPEEARQYTPPARMNAVAENPAATAFTTSNTKLAA
jgi:hypothetical protein